MKSNRSQTDCRTCRKYNQTL